MRVLVISRNAWDDTNSIGNTMSNFFGDMDNIEFASIYFRSSSPNNKLCQWYYQTSEIEIIKKWFSPRKIGHQLRLSTDGPGDKLCATAKNEHTLIRLIQKYGLKLAYRLSDSLWYSEKWINDNLRDFIESFSPDLIFTFVKFAPQYYLTVRYLRENFHIPLLSWIADDEYTVLLQKHYFRGIENLKYILKESAVVRGCSQEICDYYNEIFDCGATPLYKGCTFDTPLKEEVHSPVKMVYAGNMLYGRLPILRKIADVLEDREIGAQKILFEIYSNTVLGIEDRSFFEAKTCTRYLGTEDYEVIKQRLSEADIVLHVESFDADHMNKTKYSFSTKIIDCLQSGSVLLAVGPKEIASIKYIQNIPGAYVIDDLERLREKILSLIEDHAGLCHRAKCIRGFALIHHDRASNSKELQGIIHAIVDEER